MEQTKFTRFKRIIFLIVFTMAIALSTAFCLNTCKANRSNIQQHQIEYIDTISSNINLAVNTIRTREDVKDELIVEVTKYINTKTNKHHQFIPKYLVHAGLNYDIDICFMMAQTQLETCYGTLGAGRESSRRSLFGVAIQRYSDYEKAIEAYCKLLHKSYLVHGKTEQHLLTKYVTFSNKRYASNPNYEKELKVAYNYIKKNTHIYNLQQEYKNMDEKI